MHTLRPGRSTLLSVLVFAALGLTGCSGSDDAAVGGASSSGTSGDDGASSGTPGSSGTSGSSSGSSGSSGAPPSHADGIANLDETDVDCGGGTADGNGQAPRCADGKQCKAAADCASAFCNFTTHVCAAPTSADGFQNGDETDVDCGGSAGNPRCADGKKCTGATDCTSKVCDDAKKTCTAPTATDGVQNGDESDVDCGGTTTGAPRCAATKTCAVGEDCASGGCNYAKKCAAGRSCTLQNGGDTCGSGEVGEAGAAHEDCCTRITSASGPNGAFSVDKYLITAGRMRAFVDAVNGKVRDYISNPARKPDWWNDAWTAYLPNAWDGTGIPNGEHINIWSTYAQLAGGIIHDEPANQGCWIGAAEYGSYGHPTFYVPKDAHMKGGVMVDGAANIYGDGYSRWLTQAELDRKALNCTTWVMLAALCAYDGGQLISRQEYDFIYDVDGTGPVSPYPWGTTPNAGGYADVGGQWTKVGPASSGSTNPCPACEDDWVNWSFNYQYPPLPGGNPDFERDQAYFIASPGRFPKGASRPLNADPKSRVQDIAGLMIEATRTMTGSASYKLTFGNDAAGDDRTVTLNDVVWRGGSWEVHGLTSTWANKQFNIVTKYGKTGSRCVYY